MENCRSRSQSLFVLFALLFLSFWILFFHRARLLLDLDLEFVISRENKSLVEIFMHASTSQSCLELQFVQIPFVFESSNCSKNMHDWFWSPFFISILIFFLLDTSRLLNLEMFCSLLVFYYLIWSRSLSSQASAFSSPTLAIISVFGWRLPKMKCLCLPSVWSFVLNLLGLFTIGRSTSHGLGQVCLYDLFLFKGALLMSFACFFLEFSGFYLICF